ncbi:MAG: beta-ketoacyl-ACP synthase II [Chloroflexi bacterium]|nr:beta-ketoacyl-ACP synthase II [Chloroflexota bacterium]
MSDNRQRVVITGLGAVTPVGNNVPATWQHLIEGRSGICTIHSFDASDLSIRIAAEVKDFDPKTYFDPRELRHIDRFSQFAVVAAREALADARLNINPDESDDIAVVVGSGIGGYGTTMSEHARYLERGARRVSPFYVPMVLPDTAAAQIAIEFGIKGLNMAVVTACATGTNAIGEAAEVIRRGDADVVVCGGTEACLQPLAFASFINMGALASRNEDPASACRPFDITRNGFVMGEGAGILILESWQHAMSRDAHVYGEVIGYGSTVDANHMAAPVEGGEGLVRAMRRAFKRAGIQPGDIDYINAHGTATILNDKTETAAIKTVFGEDAYKVAISSTKSMTGHMLGAAGALEAIVCIKIMQEGIIPPTINLHNPDPECDLDYVPNQARRQRVDIALSSNMGLGGHNASIILRTV